MKSRVGNATGLDFAQDFQILFPPGQFKKQDEKKLSKKYVKNFSQVL